MQTQHSLLLILSLFLSTNVFGMNRDQYDYANLFENAESNEDSHSENTIELSEINEENTFRYWTQLPSDIQYRILQYAYGANDTTGQKLLQQLKLPRQQLSGLKSPIAYSPDGSLFAYNTTECDDKLNISYQLGIWDKKQNKTLQHCSWTASNATALAFSNNNQHLAAGYSALLTRRNASLIIWNTKTGKPIKQFQRAKRCSVDSVAFDGTNTLLAAGFEDKVIGVFNRHSGALLHELRGHTDRIQFLECNNTQLHLTSGSWDKTIRKWSMLTGQEVERVELNTNEDCKALAISQSEAIVSASLNNAVTLWDLETGQLIREIPHKNTPNKLIMSPTGELAGYTAAINPIVTIWDKDTEAPIHHIEHFSPVTCAAFSPDGNEIISCARDSAFITNLSDFYAIQIWIKQGYPTESSLIFLGDDATFYSKPVDPLFVKELIAYLLEKSSLDEQVALSTKEMAYFNLLPEPVQATLKKAIKQKSFTQQSFAKIKNIYALVLDRLLKKQERTDLPE